MVYSFSIGREVRLSRGTAHIQNQKAIEVQRAYYAETACQYDRWHVHQDDEHGLALNFLCSAIKRLDIQSVLDVGCGTGRGLLAIKQAIPSLRVLGIEPSQELRCVGYTNGLTEHELIDGDGMHL